MNNKEIDTALAMSEACIKIGRASIEISKRMSLISRILFRNPSATISFLVQFPNHELKKYLERLGGWDETINAVYET